MPDAMDDFAGLLSAALRKHQQRDFAGAQLLYEQVLAKQPEHADALHLYGCVCDDLGRLDEAVALVTRAVKSNPEAYPYFYNLANMLSRQGKWDDAIHNYRRAIALKPDYGVAYQNLGLALKKQGNRAAAKTCFQTATQLRPGDAEAHYHLGLEYMAEGSLEHAIAAYREAIRLRPLYADAHFNLGNAYSMLQRPSDAVAALQEAVRILPSNALIFTNLGVSMLKLGRLDEAIVAFDEAIRLNPQDVLNRSNQILARCYKTDDPLEIFAQCEQWALAHETPLRVNLPPPEQVADLGRALRIGYVSADFRHHAAAHWIEPLLAGHQHQGFNICCYSNSKLTDAVTTRMKALADVWVDVSALDDDALAERIRQDKIDILMDLSGHTDGNRLSMFARKPAPIQVSWFGFPVSTGLRTIDYRFSDPNIDPPGDVDHCYSEKLFRLKRFYAAFSPDPSTPAVGPSPLEQNGFVTFASLNSLAKITPDMYALWAEILCAVPRSKLVMQAAGLDDTSLCNQIRLFFEGKGVSSDRLTLRGWTSIEEFLNLGNVVDIALDPFPFNGGVTTCQALWMGLPVVTLSGRSAASRVSQSILTNIGLSQLVANSPKQYLAIAAGIGLDHTTLADLRASLRARMMAGGLLDGAALAAEVEEAYRSMWRVWCSSAQKPSADSTNR